jgi:hypothetical protein
MSGDAAHLIEYRHRYLIFVPELSQDGGSTRRSQR